MYVMCVSTKAREKYPLLFRVVHGSSRVHMVFVQQREKLHTYAFFLSLSQTTISTSLTIQDFMAEQFLP